MDGFFLRVLRIFKSVGGFLAMLFLTLIPVSTAAGAEGAETIGKSAPRVKTVQGSLEGVWVDASKVYRGFPTRGHPSRAFAGSLRNPSTPGQAYNPRRLLVPLVHNRCGSIT